MRERVGCVARTSTASILKRLWQVPVVQGCIRLETARQHPVYQAVVKVQTLAVDLACSSREDTRPRERKAVSAYAQTLYQLEVMLPEVIVVAGNFAGVAVFDLAGDRAEGVPDGGATTIFTGRSFDLTI